VKVVTVNVDTVNVDTVDHVAVDWSGAKVGAHRRIWLAHVRDGALITLSGGRSREEVIDHLIELRAQCPHGLVVGLDFAFSFPLWFLRHQGYATIADVWDGVAEEGERWLAQCDPPFWGRPGRPRPALPEHLRRAEQRVAATALASGTGTGSGSGTGVKPKSVFQVGGAGTVGTGSIRGMPLLRRLRSSGFSIWPFDPPSPSLVAEIYPRLLTGPVRKRNPAARASYLSGSPRQLPPEFVQAMCDSEDAFDAGLSALALSDYQLGPGEVTQATDARTLLEGDIWPPRNIAP
jgi:hypothetical protein